MRPLIRHADEDEVTRPAPPRDPGLVAAVRGHVERHLGPVGAVIEDPDERVVAIDLLHVPAMRGTSLGALVTCGMSALPMTAAPDEEEFRFSELYVLLAGVWPVEGEVARHPLLFWPQVWLREIARFPHQYGSILLPRQTVGPLPEAPGAGFQSALVTVPVSLPGEFMFLELAPGRTIRFHCMIPLHKEELDFSLKNGMDPLEDLLLEAGVSEAINPKRKRVVRKKFLGLF